MKENVSIVNYGVIGCGDNLVRKIIISSESTQGIQIISLADIYPTLTETLNHLRNRKNDDGTPMYSGKLETNMQRLLDLERGGLLSYFPIDDNGEIPHEFFQLSNGGQVHIVHVSTPDDTHGHYSVLVARQKTHILCEKPFAISSADAVQILWEINKERDGKELAQISATHYIRYGPSQEFLKNLKGIVARAGPITEISAEFVEDRTYLNQRTKDLFRTRGAIYDMLVHYIALVHKMGATINTKANLNSGLGHTTTYTLPGYENETAVISLHGLTGPNFSPGAILYLKAVKGDTINSKNVIVKFKKNRLIRLDYLPGSVGILDSEVAAKREEQWWNDDEVRRDPFQRIYLEGRDEVRRLSFGIDGGFRVSHTLEDTINDLVVLDKIRTNSDKDPYENYYGMRCR